MYESASETSNKDVCDSSRSGIKRTTLELNSRKSKRPKLSNYITSDTTMSKFDFNSYALNFKLDKHISPIKSTPKTKDPNLHKLKKGQVTAVVGLPLFKPEQANSRREAKKNSWRILLDSGSDGDILFRQRGTKSHNVPYTKRLHPQTWHTSNGLFQTTKVGDFEVVFPEYSRSKRFRIHPDIVEYENEDEAHAFDLIIGIQTMTELGIVLDFKTRYITIDEIKLPMRKLEDLQTRQQRSAILSATEPLSTAGATKRAVKILDAKYEAADLKSVVKLQCDHLKEHDQHMLLELLEEYAELFDGTLGEFNTEPVSLELKEGAKPYHGKAFPVPHIHLETLRKEVKRLCEIGVLERQPASEWGSPTFIIAKKQGTVRFLTDFREVNKRLVRKPFPIPKITTVLQELEGFQYATQLDLNMGYYTIRLDPDASKICTIVLPWGKYSYKRLPMGISGSPDIFQEKMSNLMATLEYVRTYLDDLLVISKDDFNDHLDKVKEVLKRLRQANLRVNVSKSTFAQSEVEYLGYILTRDGIKPQPDKVQAILALQPPTSVKTLRSFLGIVQYYRDMWEKRSEMLAPLTDLVAECGVTKATKQKGTRKRAWYWDAKHQKAFDDIKATISKDVVLAYPDYSKPFEIYTDASTKQLGAVIVQDNRPVAFFSRKLSDAQTRYSITELELLAIVETLKEFKGMLWGQRIKVFTDHKNLITDALGLSSDRVYRWRLLLEEYGPEIVYIKGIHNTVADAISRLEYDPAVNPDRLSYHMSHVQTRVEHDTGISREQFKWKAVTNRLVNYHHKMISSTEKVNYSLTKSSQTKRYSRASRHSSIKLDPMTLGQVFANSAQEDEVYPLTIPEIAEQQHKDKTLKRYFTQGGDRFEVKLVEDTNILVDETGKLVIPKKLQSRCIQWYHHYLQHPGHTRLEETIRATMTWSGMRTQIRRHVKTCPTCQKNKRRSLKYGKLPTKIVVSIPWKALCVDLVGPYTLKAKDGTVLDFMCLTMIDPTSGWFEIAELPVHEILKKKKSKNKGKLEKTEYFDKTSAQISRLVNKSWFSRYPRCQQIIYDNGSEFKLHFEDLCETYGIKRKPTTIKNPTANAILERVHQVVTSMLRTSELDMAETLTPADISDFLDDAAWAIRSTYHTVLKASPGAAIFGRDMLFDIPFIADWRKIGEYRQIQTDNNTKRENKSRIDFDYVVGGEVLLRKDGILRKAETRYTGPWTITQVHTNGNIRIQCGNKSERLNIRRVIPYNRTA